MRILVLNERDPRHPKAGGAEIHVSEIFRRLVDRGHQVTLMASSFPGSEADDTFAGMKIQRLGRLPLYYARVPFVVAKATRSSEFDIVVECLNKVPFYSAIYSRAPVLAICHHLFGEVAFAQVAWPVAAAVWGLECLIPMLYRRESFVAISESSRADLIRRGIDAQRIEVSHCGIDVPRIPVDVDAARPLRVSYVGRLETYKNVDIMLRACAALVPRFPEIEILVIGRGHAREALERQVDELGIRRRTRFTGFVTDDERDALLAETRVCVCPSDKEGWGLTIIESNAVGTPVVATDADGLRDSVQDGVTGLLAPAGEVEGFRRRIEKFLDDEDFAIGMSKRALAWSRKFSWATAADEMETALLRVIQERGA